MTHHRDSGQCDFVAAVARLEGAICWSGGPSARVASLSEAVDHGRCGLLARHDGFVAFEDGLSLLRDE